jgi:two-component system alkaline phosphatase synthesis response regulator PhoP
MIICLEDDSNIRDIEVYTLQSVGFDATGVSDSVGLFETISQIKPELIILDIMLPGEDGVTVLKKIRSNPATKSIPIIMATAKGSEFDKIESLDSGADDYLVKPFGMMEMVAHVRAVLRRSGGRNDSSLLKAGGIIMSSEEHTVMVNGRPLNLTFKEFELLRLFLSNPGIVFSRDQLLSSVWGKDYTGETRTVDVHILTLRQKLGECGSYISTVRGVGYRLEVVK